MITIAIETPDQDDVRELIRLSDAHSKDLYPAESCHLVDLEELSDPAVKMLVARREGAAVGCIALVTSGGAGEIKRLFVCEAGRGAGVGARLIAALENEAAGAGTNLLQLETGIYQPEAIGLYEKCGFRRRGPFGQYGPDPLSVFMEKDLS